MHRLEENANQENDQADLFSVTSESVEVTPVDESAQALRKTLEAINADSLSPKEALDLVYRLKASLNQ